MRKNNEKGFVLFVVVGFLAILSIILAAMSNHLKNLNYETKAQMMKVQNENLLLSAAAWANLNKLKLSEKTAGQTVDLDISQLGIINSAASIKVTAIEPEQIKISLTAQCKRARIQLKRTAKTAIDVPKKTKQDIKQKPEASDPNSL